MNDLCRLCLQVSTELIHNLYENSHTMQKLSCLNIEILNEELLPNSICFNCNKQVDDLLTFLKTVIQNQKNLYQHYKLGKENLDNFYSLLKNIKTEIDTNVDQKEEFEIEINTENCAIDASVKFEDENVYYSSDDNITLMSLKETKEDHKKQNTIIETKKRTVKKKLKKSKKSKKSKKLKKISDTKENIEECTEKVTFELEYKCLTCLEIFDSRATLTLHYKQAHKPTDPVTCNRENFTVVKDGNEDKFTCNYCNKAYDTRKSVRGHILYKHDENRPYVCKLCGARYKVISEIVSHQRAHSNAKQFCSYGCGYSSAYSGCLQTHEKKHRDEFKYRCEKCGKGFDTKTWYEEHQNFHSGAKPFVCNLCGLAYHCKRYLVKHQTEYHPVEHSPSDKTRFVCVHCSRPCGNKIALRKHMSKAHGIKHYLLCDVCGKSFQRITHLKAHKKRHLGLKNFTCSTCNKSYSELSGLKRHSLTHIRYKLRPYGCEQCGERYKLKADLLLHEYRHHSVPTSEK